jgi:cellulose synthase/poly-beta-1,6-N-acetylglucosamine synthase-like glycosyltransferase
MAAIIFWSAFTVIAYVYIGYALTLKLWQRLARRPVHKRYQELSVSVVMAMHNERRNVRAKLHNCFELDYPADKLQFIVSLDATTDGTDDLLRDYAGRHIDIVSCPVRGGKAEALNRGMAIATGEIVMFVDAEQRLEKSALRELVANFADESVGAVSGELVLLDEDGKEATDGVGLYWRYEKSLRAMESDIHSVPGATGAIYAIRRDLFVPLSSGTILDDVIVPMALVLGGHRAIFDPAARAYGAVTQSPAIEYEKKKRTLTGNYQLLAEMPQLLVPWRNPIFVQVVSHKVGRLIVPYCLAALFIANVFVFDGFYRLAMLAQVMWYITACAGWWVSRRPEVLPRTTEKRRGSKGKMGRTLGKLALIPYTFILMNWAAVAGLYCFVRGRSLGIWDAVAMKPAAEERKA